MISACKKCYYMFIRVAEMVFIHASSCGPSCVLSFLDPFLCWLGHFLCWVLFFILLVDDCRLNGWQVIVIYFQLGSTMEANSLICQPKNMLGGKSRLLTIVIQICGQFVLYIG